MAFACPYHLADNTCTVMTLLAGVPNMVDPATTCARRCGPDIFSKHKFMIKMYRGRGELPTPPVGGELLTVYQAAIDAGEYVPSPQRPDPSGQRTQAAAAKQKKGCCGKAAAILRGFFELSKHKLAGTDPPEFASRRIDECLKCDHRTWLNVVEWGYDVLLKATGEPLPVKHDQGRYDVLWCSLCTCCVQAAALVPDKKCLADKWDKEETDNAD